jgi:hypothetical protein
LRTIITGNSLRSSRRQEEIKAAEESLEEDELESAIKEIEAKQQAEFDRLQAEFTENLNETIKIPSKNRKPYRLRNKQGSRQRKTRIQKKKKFEAIFVDLPGQFPAF